MKKGTIQERYPFLHLKITHTPYMEKHFIASNITPGKQVFVPAREESWQYGGISFYRHEDCYRYMIATVREQCVEILIKSEDLNWDHYGLLRYQKEVGNIGCGRYGNGRGGEFYWLTGYQLNGCPVRNYAILYWRSWSELEVKRSGIRLIRRHCKRFLKNERLK